MSTNRLGRAEDLDEHWTEQLLDESPELELVGEIERSTAEPLISNYPYSRQLILTGRFEYEMQGRHEARVAYNGSFEYRADSGVFLIDSTTDRVEPRDIFKELNEYLSRKRKLKDALSLDREALWEFIESADLIEELRLKGPEGEYDAVDLLDVVNSDSPLQTLDNMEFEDEYSEKALRSMVKKLNPSADSPSLYDLDIDLYKTTIGKVTATFWYEGYTSTVTFRRGILSITGESSDAREYLIQKFERDVLYPSYE